MIAVEPFPSAMFGHQNGFVELLNKGERLRADPGISCHQDKPCRHRQHGVQFRQRAMVGRAQPFALDQTDQTRSIRRRQIADQ